MEAQVPDVHLVIAGDGPALPSLKRQAEEGGLGGRVHFLGWREEIGTVLAGLEVFAHPTPLEFPGPRLRVVNQEPIVAGEPSGRSVVEASAVGVPVVVTDAGGHREIVVHGKTGLLVPSGDPVRLAQAVVELLSDPARRRSMGQAGRERARREYSLPALGCRYHELIQELLSQRHVQLSRG